MRVSWCFCLRRKGHPTLVLCSCVESQGDELQLVDLVCEALDEGFEEGYPLFGALWVVEEFDELVGKLVP